MAHRDLIVIGASAGGLDVIREIVSGLPEDLPAAVAIVVHSSPNGPGLLPTILNRDSRLRAAVAVDGEPLRCGRIYLAPLNRHLLIEPTGPALGDGPRENGFRPAIDPLFRSAADAFGSRVIGVILSGAMDDGIAGLAAIKERGGVAVVQDPATALIGSMPASAIRHVPVDHIVDIPAISSLLTSLTRDKIETRLEVAMGGQREHTRHDIDIDSGTANMFRCPDCGGPMREMRDPHVLRFRCHEGHAYSAGSLFAAQMDQNQASLRETASSLREQAMLGRLVAERSKARGDERFAEFVMRTVERLERRVEQVNELLQNSENDSGLEAGGS